MKTAKTAEVGQRAGTLTCHGRPMKPVGDGIYECWCDCYVTVDEVDVIEAVRRCNDRHN
jgi:hypothetical protein